MANQTSNYQLKIGVVTDQASFKILQQSLQNIINLAKQPGNELNKELQQAAKNAQLTQKALADSFNTKTGTLNIAKMNKELEKSNLNVNTLRNSFSKVGADGANAFNTLAAASMRAGVQIKKTNKLLDSFATTMTNTVKWGITSGIWNSITSQLSGAVTYVEKLDHSLNDIRIVTNKNASAMTEFAKQANKAAQALGASTTDYTDAALIYYQQGLAEAEVKARTEVTMKTANVTRQSTDEVSEQLTAVWNGYKVSAQEAELYIDKLAAVAASTAADLEELSTGMSKVASAASEMGVDVDQLNAQLATIVSVTRQAPESVGTALKTIYARMGDLAIGGEDEFGVSLGTVSGQLAEVGIAVLDQSGNLRDMGDVIEEVAGKWDTWNESQRTAVAIAMAGKRQYNNLIALFSNWDMYSEAIETSENAMGTLARQQDIYMESTDAKLQKVTTSWEKLYSTLIKTNELNWGIDAINQLVQSFDNLASSFGGGIKTIGAAVAIIASLSSSKIGEGLINRGRNQAIDRANASTIRLRDQVKESSLIDTFNIQEGSARAIMLENQARENTDFVEKYDAVRAGLTNEQYNKIIDYARKRADINYQADERKWDNEQSIKEYNKRFSKNNQEILKLNEKKDNLFGEKKKEVEDEIKLLKQRNQEIKKNIDALKEENIAIDKKAANDVSDIQQTLDDEIGNVEDLQKYANMQMQLDALAGSAQLVAGSIMSVHSAFEIWSNDDLSFTEKLTQSIMSLTPAISLAISGIKKLNSEELKGKTISDLFSGSKIKQTLATIFGTKAKKADTEATKANTVETLKNAGADALETKTEMASGGADLGGALAKTPAAKKGITAIGAKLGGATLGVTAGIAATIIAGVALYNAHVKKQLENDLKDMQASAEDAAKKTQKALNEATNMQKVVNNLKDLKQQLDEEETSLTEVQIRMHDLLVEYGEADLANQALAMSYEQLEITIEEAFSKKNQDAIDSITTSLATQNAVLEQTAKLYNHNQGFFYNLTHNAEEENQFTLKRGIIQEKDKAFIEDLKKIEGINFDNDNGSLISFDYDKLDFEELQRTMSLWSGTLAGDRYYKSWQELIATIEAPATKYIKDLETQNQLNISNLTAPIGADDITTLSEYQKIYNDLFSRGSQYFDSTEDATNYLRNYLGTLSDESKEFMITDAIMRDLNTSSKFIQDWTDDEKNYIYLHLDTVSTLQQAEDLLSEMGDFLDISEANTGMNIANSLFAVEGRLNTDQIENLYNGTNFSDATGIEQAVFSAMSETQQKSALLQYSFEQLEYIIAHQSEVEQQLLNSIHQYEEDNSGLESQYNEVQNQLIAFTESAAESEKYTGTVKNNLSDINNILAIIEEYDYEQYATEYEAIAEATGLTIEEIQKLIKEYKKYRNELTKQKGDLATVRNLTDSYADALERADTNLEKHEKGLSTMNSAYNTLTGIISDYNKTGKFTIDNLLSLMSLEPEYIALLSWENGQLELSEKGMKDLALARLEEAKAAIVQQGAAALAALAQGKAQQSAELVNQALSEQEAQLYNTAAAWNAYANSVYAGVMSSQEAQNIRDSVATQLESIDKIIGEINLNGIGAAMGKEIAEGITKVWDEEFNRYWTQNKIIEKLNDTLEDLKDIREHLSGDELRENLEAENTLIKEQIGNYEELLAAQKEEQKELQNELKGYGVKFNEKGEISNYEAVTHAQTDRLNNIGTEEAEEYFNGFKNTLERYDELFYDEMKDTLEQIEELTEQMIDNNFEIWTSQIEDMLEKFEDARDFNDYNTEMLKDFRQVYEDLGLVQDNLTKNFESLANDTIPTIIMDMEKAEREIEKLAANENSEMFHSMSQAQEYLKEKQEELRDAALETKEVYEDLYNTYLDLIDQSIDKMEDLYDEFNRVNEHLEYQAELIELLYGEKAYNLYSELYNAQLHTSQKELSSLMQEKKVYEELYAQAEEGTKDQLKYKERLYELESEINNKVIEHINILKEDYANAVDQILNDLEKKITNGSSLSDWEEEWDRIKEKADKYYNTVEGLYQIQTLNNKMIEEINKTSLKGQKELQKVRDREINYLKEKKDLTEYDIQAAEARYEIALKQIALEEAQQNKNSMKLVRDNNGNWTYQYVANQEDIMNKEQDLLDAYQKLYELADQAYKSNIDSLVTLNKEYIESAREIANDSTLNEEQRVQKLEELRDRYLKDYKLLVEENQLYTDDLAIAYNANLMALFQANEDNLNEMTPIEQKIIADMIDQNLLDFNRLVNWLNGNGDSTSLKDTMIAVMQQGYDGWSQSAKDMIDLWTGEGGEGQLSIESAITQATGNIVDKIGEFDLKVQELSKTVNQEFNTEEGIIESFNNAKTKVGEIADKISEVIPGIKTDLTSFSELVRGIGQDWNDVATKIGDAISKYQEFAGLEDPITKTLEVLLNYKEHPGGEDANDVDTNPLDLPPLDEKGKEEPKLDNNNNKIIIGLTNANPDISYQEEQETLGGNQGKDEQEKISNIWNKYREEEKRDIENLTAANDRLNQAYPPKTSIDTSLYPSVPVNNNKTTTSQGSALTIKDSNSNGNTDKSSFLDKTLDIIKKMRGITLPIGFDTGGYTGDWSSTSGRIALLHQKELVLNQADTKNVLEAISTMRSITGLNSSVNDAIMRGISKMMLEMSNMNTHANYNTEASKSVGDTIYEIHAEFPDANDVNSIREAILSLPNLASQRVSKYNTP